MEDDRYERMRVEYDRVYLEYEVAVSDMLKIAADPDSDVAEFRNLSERVAQLADQLATIRTATKLVHESKDFSSRA